MNNNELHREMQRLGVSLIHVHDHWLHGNPSTWPGTPFVGANWEGNWPSYVSWENRAVLVKTSALGDKGRLLHEVVHAIYDEPPYDMSAETYTWMYAAEYSLARRWGCLDEWLYYMRTTPIELESGGQDLWKWMNATTQLQWLKQWRNLLREAGLMKHNHFIPPGRHGGQDIHMLPRGFYELVDEQEEEYSYRFERSSYVVS